jgi:hypothetical protein
MADNELVKQEMNRSIGLYNYGDYSGVGFEETKGSDLSIPFMNLLQSNSPEVEEELVPGAKTGDMLNTVTGELIKGDTGFVFLPVHKEEAWVEWVPRIKGGGFVGMHDPNGELVNELIKANGGSRIPPKGNDGKRISFKNGDNEIIESYYVYGLILNQEGNDTESFAVISFSSTKIKPYRDWLTSMYLIKGKPPMFANRARFKSVKQKNEAGTYANFTISPFKETWAKSLIDPVSEKYLIDQAISFREMVLKGVARADFNQQQNAAVGDTIETEKAPF